MIPCHDHQGSYDIWWLCILIFWESSQAAFPGWQRCWIFTFFLVYFILNDIFFETRVENLEPKEKKEIFHRVQEIQEKEREGTTKRHKWEDPASLNIVPSEYSSVECKSNKKYCIIHEKRSHSTHTWKDLYAIINKYRQKKKKSFRSYWKNNKELNAVSEKKFQKFVKND